MQNDFLQAPGYFFSPFTLWLSPLNMRLYFLGRGEPWECSSSFRIKKRDFSVQLACLTS